MAARDAVARTDWPAIESLEARAYTVPTDRPESDGTYEWTSTTIVVVHVVAGDHVGLGYTYAHAAAAELINEKLIEAVWDGSPMHPTAAWWAMCDSVRNTPRRGLAMFAISAVDCALWDLKARLLDVSLVDLLGSVRERVDVYGSGGFTSYSERELCDQLAGWVEQGIPRVKMKVGRDAQADPARVRAARNAIGEAAELFVDANGAYSAMQASRLAHEFAKVGVTWFEEPRPSDDFRGLQCVRKDAPAGMDIAAGEYGDVESTYVRMIDADVADVLQIDVSRCGGATGALRLAALCGAHHVPLSIHCVPALSVAVGCACREIRHIEHFHDHVRLESVLFDGVLTPTGGALEPDRTAPGNGLRLKVVDADRHLV